MVRCENTASLPSGLLKRWVTAALDSLPAVTPQKYRMYASNISMYHTSAPFVNIMISLGISIVLLSHPFIFVTLLLNPDP